HELTHQGGRLAREVMLLGGLHGVLENTRQRRHAAPKRHRPLRAPHDVLRLCGEAPKGRTATRCLVPNGDPTPDPTARLHGPRTRGAPAPHSSPRTPRASTPADRLEIARRSNKADR